MRFQDEEGLVSIQTIVRRDKDGKWYGGAEIGGYESYDIALECADACKSCLIEDMTKFGVKAVESQVVSLVKDEASDVRPAHAGDDQKSPTD